MLFEKDRSRPDSESLDPTTIQTMSKHSITEARKNRLLQAAEAEGGQLSVGITVVIAIKIITIKMFFGSHPSNNVKCYPFF